MLFLQQGVFRSVSHCGRDERPSRLLPAEQGAGEEAAAGLCSPKLQGFRLARRRRRPVLLAVSAVHLGCLTGKLQKLALKPGRGVGEQRRTGPEAVPARRVAPRRALMHAGRHFGHVPKQPSPHRVRSALGLHQAPKHGPRLLRQVGPAGPGPLHLRAAAQHPGDRVDSERMVFQMENI